MSSTILFALLEHRVRKMSRRRGRGAPMIFAAVCSLSAGGSCGLLHQQFPYQTVTAAGQHALNGTPVEGGEDGWRGGLLFSAGGESVGAVVPSWR